MSIVISVCDTVVSEADSYADVVVRLSAPSAEVVTVSYATGYSTAFTGDFDAVSGSLTFASGVTSQVVRVPIVNDATAESLESFFFKLSNPSVNAKIGNPEAVITIVDNDASVGTPNISVRDVVVDETAQVAQFVVMLDKPSTTTVGVSYSTAGGTAGAGTDFTATSGSLSFRPGETSKTVLVPITNDTLAESDELFSLVLSSPSNAALAQATGTARIAANDAPTVMVPVISMQDMAVSEADGYADVVVRLSAPSAEVVTVSYATGYSTAFTGDFDAVSGSLTFASGVTSQVVRVPIVNDATAESLESFFFKLSNPSVNASVGTAQSTITIYDGNTKPPATPTVSYTVAPAATAVNEGSTVSYTVNTTGLASGTVLGYRLSGVSTADVGSGNLSGSVTVGSTGQASVNVALRADQQTEGNETLTLELLNGATVVATATPVTVVDTSTAATTVSYTVTPAATSVNEGASLTYTVNTTGLASGTVLGYRLSGVSTADVGSGSLSGSVTVGSNGQASINVALRADQQTEGNETLTFELLNGATVVATATAVTVVDSSKAAGNAPLIVIDARPTVVSEAVGNAEVVVQLSVPSTEVVTVSYITYPANSQISDFRTVSGTLTFTPGEVSRVVQVPIVNDTAAESLESFVIKLFDPSSNAEVGHTYQVITIVDNDASVGTPNISVRDVVVDETAQVAQFVVTLDKPSTSTVGVSYSTAGGTAGAGTDFTDTRGSLSFRPGETSKTVLVPITNDTLGESDEFFSLVLSSPSNAALAQATGTARITANDAPTVMVPVISTQDMAVSEADGYADVVVRLSAPSAEVVTVRYSMVSSTASSLYDFEADGTHILAFAPGMTSQVVRVPIINDAIAESPESFFFKLSHPSVNASVGTDQSTVTIYDGNTQPPVTPTVSYTVTPAATSVNEGASLTYNVNTTGLASGTVLGYRLSGVSTADVGSGSISGSVAVGTTGQASVNVALLADLQTEGNETLTLELLNGTTVVATATAVTVVDSSKAAGNAPVVSLASSAYWIIETDSDVNYWTIPVTLSAAATTPVSVAFSLLEGSALSVRDFVGINGTLVFNPGETSNSIDIGIVGDRDTESTETFQIVLANPVGATLGAETRTTIEIFDNDGALQLTGTSANDYLEGMAGDDTIYGLGGQDSLRGHGGNDFLDGGEGTDYANYFYNRSNYQIQKTENGIVVSGGFEGTDQLRNIERLVFSDVGVAFDMELGQAGGNAALVIGALLGKAALGNTSLMRDAMTFFDAHATLADGVKTLTDLGLVNLVAGASTTAVVATLFQNITGSQPTELINMIASSVGNGVGQQTLAQFVTAAASLDLNQEQIDLVGLANTGMAYAHQPIWI